MPNMVITESDFEKLSDSTKKELLDLFYQAFPQSVGKDNDRTGRKPEISSEASSDNILSGSDFFSPSLMGTQWQYERSKVRESASTYQEYLEGIEKVHLGLENHLDMSRTMRVDSISVEFAIAILIGLKPESFNLLKKIVDRGMATREELTEVLGDAKKINGTIGSINRRFSKRFDRNLYGSLTDRLKLVEFNKHFQKYTLCCDSAASGAIHKAIYIVKEGYKIGSGNICLTYDATYTSGKNQKHTEQKRLVLEEEAIIAADNGKGFITRLAVSDDNSIETRTLSVSAATTVPSGNFIWDQGGIEFWFTDEEELLDVASINMHNNGYKITFGGQVSWLEGKYSK